MGDDLFIIVEDNDNDDDDDYDHKKGGTIFNSMVQDETKAEDSTKTTKTATKNADTLEEECFSNQSDDDKEEKKEKKMIMENEKYNISTTKTTTTTTTTTPTTTTASISTIEPTKRHLSRSSLKSYDIKDIPVCTKPSSWMVLNSPDILKIKKDQRKPSRLKNSESVSSFFSSFFHMQQQKQQQLRSDTESSLLCNSITESNNNNHKLGTKSLDDIDDEMTTSSSTSNDNNNKLTCDKRNVSFNNISIREYDLTIGDNPSVSKGIPISLDWNYENVVDDMCLEAYESNRIYNRRGRDEMRLNRFQRENILLYSYGHTRSEIRAAYEENIKIKKEREQTNKRLNLMNVEEKIEKAVRGVRKMKRRLSI